MAIQVVCNHCGRVFFMSQVNTEIKPLELDWQRVEAVCPKCACLSEGHLSPLKPKPEALQAPTEVTAQGFVFPPGSMVSQARVIVTGEPVVAWDQQSPPPKESDGEAANELVTQKTEPNLVP